MMSMRIRSISGFASSVSRQLAPSVAMCRCRPFVSSMLPSAKRLRMSSSTMSTVLPLMMFSLSWTMWIMLRWRSGRFRSRRCRKSVVSSMSRSGDRSPLRITRWANPLRSASSVCESSLPVSTITGIWSVDASCRSLRSRSIPEMSGKPRSRIMQSNDSAAIRSIAAAPFCAVVTSKPVSLTNSTTSEETAASSSTTNSFRIESKAKCSIVPKASFRASMLTGFLRKPTAPMSSALMCFSVPEITCTGM